MVVGRITIATCYGDADIPVELLGKGPRPGTAWVKALNGFQPFTKISHGGPYQDDTSIVPLLYVRDVVSIFDSLLCRFTAIATVSTQMLLGVRTFNDDLVQNEFKLTHIVSVCSGYDYR